MDCQIYFFEDDGFIPNNPLCPLLLYPDALSENLLESSKCRDMLNTHGWSNSWVNGIYSYHHYHSTTHEVLVVLEGTATVMMGGEHGERLAFSPGDAVVIPAGVGHCRISSSKDFKVIGAYPGGRDYDLCTGKADERPRALHNIKEVPMPERDPVSGEKDPLYKHWKKS